MAMLRQSRASQVGPRRQATEERLRQDPVGKEIVVPAGFDVVALCLLVEVKRTAMAPPACMGSGIVPSTVLLQMRIRYH